METTTKMTSTTSTTELRWYPYCSIQSGRYPYGLWYLLLSAGEPTRLNGKNVVARENFAGSWMSAHKRIQQIWIDARLAAIVKNEEEGR